MSRVRSRQLRRLIPQDLRDLLTEASHLVAVFGGKMRLIAPFHEGNRAGRCRPGTGRKHPHVASIRRASQGPAEIEAIVTGRQRKKGCLKISPLRDAKRPELRKVRDFRSRIRRVDQLKYFFARVLKVQERISPTATRTTTLSAIPSHTSPPPPANPSSRKNVKGRPYGKK